MQLTWQLTAVNKASTVDIKTICQIYNKAQIKSQIKYKCIRISNAGRTLLWTSTWCVISNRLQLDGLKLKQAFSCGHKKGSLFRVHSSVSVWNRLWKKQSQETRISSTTTKQSNKHVSELQVKWSKRVWILIFKPSCYGHMEFCLGSWTKWLSF